jgi:hypothetical protein
MQHCERNNMKIQSPAAYVWRGFVVFAAGFALSPAKDPSLRALPAG